MTEKFPFSWDDIHIHFPKEKVARLRKELIKEYCSGKLSDKELMERYHMSKQTFYDTIERYKDAVELTDFMDESKAPKNPHRTILPEHEDIIKDIIKSDREELRKKEHQFEADMELSGKDINKEKLKRLKKEMRHSLKGCRKIANEFNMRMSENGEDISISKTRVNEIMRKMTMYLLVEEKQLDGHLTRPPEPFMAFAMDFTEKVIAGGERTYILDILDKYDNEKIILDAHKIQDADAVICSLEKFNTVFGHSGITITVDNGKEFKNGRVLDYCSRHNIYFDFVNKGSPWENGFVERDIRTLHEECLNLVWINDFTEIQPLLDDFKQKSNFRPNMAFGYMSPFEKLEMCLKEEKRLRGKDKVYRIDLELDRIMTCFKMSFVNLCSFFLKRCFNGEKMELLTLFESIFQLDGSASISNEKKTIELEMNPKEPKLMDKLNNGLDILNTMNVYDLDKHLIEFKL